MMMPTATDPTYGNCACCRRSTTNRCTGCLESPLYDESTLKPTYYCGLACQRAAWDEHKAQCRKLQVRKSLHRAALLLQAIMYKIRLYASPLRFKSVRVQSSTIYLDQFQFDVTAGQQYLRPFPASLDVEQSLFDAVLVYMGCTEAMMYLYSFAKEFLAELCSKVEEVNVSLINQKVRISLISNGQQIDPPGSSFHNLYRVTLKNGEIWAVDTTGAQHGYEDPLCPWPYFKQHRSNKINRELNFGYIRHQAYQSHGMFPARCIVAQKIEKEELAKALEEKIPAIAQEHGGKLNAILRGSNAAFKQAKITFVDQFEGHLRACVIELYAPQQIRRRNKEIESQLSQNRGDPERRKDLDGMMRFIESAMSTTGP